MTAKWLEKLGRGNNEEGQRAAKLDDRCFKLGQLGAKKGELGSGGSTIPPAPVQAEAPFLPS